MIRIYELFFTKAKALQFRTQSLDAFPPAVFGTVLRVIPAGDGLWQCVGARFP